MTATTISAFPSMHTWSSPRAWVLAIIVLLHVGFFWALSSGLTPSVIKAFISQPPVYLPQIQPVPEKPIKIEEPVIKTRELRPIAPKPQIDLPPEPVETHAPYAPVPTPANDFFSHGDVVAPPQPVIVEPRIDARRGLSEPHYPAQVIREGGQGTVLLSLYILADGRVGEVVLAGSSGHAKLDESAMREAKKWRFVPGTRDGKPVAMWKQVPVTFRLNTRM
jgi:protein TonB